MAQAQYMQRQEQPVSEGQQYPTSYSTNGLQSRSQDGGLHGRGQYPPPSRNHANGHRGYEHDKPPNRPKINGWQYTKSQEFYQAETDLQPPSAQFHQPHMRRRSYNYDSRYQEHRQDGLDYAIPPPQDRGHRNGSYRPAPLEKRPKREWHDNHLRQAVTNNLL